MSLDDIILISIELSIPVVGGILFIAPIAIFVYSLMKKRKKLFIGACVAVFLEAMLILFWASHKTYYKYNEWWIVGKSEEEIVERYGEFDKKWGKSKAYYIHLDNAWDLPPYLYYIEFDSAGIATKVYVDLAPGG